MGAVTSASLCAVACELAGYVERLAGVLVQQVMSDIMVYLQPGYLANKTLIKTKRCTESDRIIINIYAQPKVVAMCIEGKYARTPPPPSLRKGWPKLRFIAGLS